jgi:hypothetical protein
MWAACFGCFAVIFLGGEVATEGGRMTSSMARMKAGTYIDLVNMLSWLISMIWCCVSGRRSSPPMRRVEEHPDLERQQDSEAYQDVDAQMAEAMIRKQQQDPCLEERCSRPPSYRSQSSDESKTLEDEAKMLEDESKMMVEEATVPLAPTRDDRNSMESTKNLLFQQRD